MDRGFDAGVAVVPDVNGNMNGNMDMDMNARTTIEMCPAAVPVGRGEPTVEGVGTGEGMILPPQSERWLSGIFRAIPSTQRIRAFVRTPEMVIFLLGLATLETIARNQSVLDMPWRCNTFFRRLLHEISLLSFIFDVITMKTFRPLTVTVFLSTGGYCVLLIQRPRCLNEADQVLVEIMEVTAAGASDRVITKEERRSMFHYFTLRPPTPLENAFSYEDAPTGASTLSGASTPSGDGDGRGAEDFSMKALDQSSWYGDEAGRAQSGHPLNATVPSRGAHLGGGESSVLKKKETRTVEIETRRGQRRSGSALRKVFRRPSSDGVDVMASIGTGAQGQQPPDRAAFGEIVDETPREEEGVCAGACSMGDAIAGCSRARHAYSAPEERAKDGKKEALRRASLNWGTGGQSVVCFEEYAHGEDLCQLPCCHMYHAGCLDDWLDGADHNWCPVCKKSVMGDDRDQEISGGGDGIDGEAI